MNVTGKTFSTSHVISQRVSLKIAPQTADAISSDLTVSTDFRLACTHTDLYGAFHLLQRRYTASGLSASTQPIRVEPFHLWKESQVFVAVRSGKVVGCMTLLQPGNPAGLPLERSNVDVFDSLPQGARVAEVTSLAIDNEIAPHTSEIFLGLLQLVQLFALSSGIDHAVAVVHPKHAKVYKKAMGFRVIGDAAPCGRVDGRPGVALLGKIDQASLCLPRWQNRFAPDRDCDADLQPQPMTERQRRFFSYYMTNHQVTSEFNRLRKYQLAG